VGDDNENGDLIGVVHNQAHNLSTDLLLKLGLFKPNSIPPTFNLFITMPQGMKEMVALPNSVMDLQQPCQVPSFNNVQGGSMGNILVGMQSK
jgi:hypothetical protein